MDFLRGSSGRPDADILIVGEAYGADEERAGKPFVGASGNELTNILLDAGINRNDCLLTNVVNSQPRDNDFTHFLYPTKEAPATSAFQGLYCRPILKQGLENLEHTIRICKPKVIIAVGNYALWALTNRATVATKAGYRIPSGIMNWRGSQLYATDTFSRVPTVPIIHPAAILRAWDNRFWTVHDLRTRVPLALNGNFGAPPYGFKIAWPENENLRIVYNQLIGRLAAGEKIQFAVDLETYQRSLVVCLGMAWSETEALAIPFFRLVNEKPESIWSIPQEVQIKLWLRTLFRHPNATIVGQNFLYDLQWFPYEMGFVPRCDFDTMLGQHILLPGTPKSLDFLSSLHCEYHCFWKNESQEWSVKETGLDDLLQYNCKDCCATWEIANSQRVQIEKAGLSTQFAHQMEQFNLALSMMQRGVKIDKKLRFQLKIELTEAANALAVWFEKVLPPSLRAYGPNTKTPWYKSPSKLKAILYEGLGIKPIKSRGTGAVTTNAEALEEIREKEPMFRPLIDRLLMYRSLGVFHNTFLSAKLDRDGRMRCSNNVGGTSTYRWSTSQNARGTGTNLQNIPKGDKEE